jgi:hypothetical protein
MNTKEAWKCGKCDELYYDKADADRCCLAVLSIGQVWVSEVDESYAVIYNVRDNVSYFVTGIGLTDSRQYAEFLEMFPTLIKG